MSYSKHEIPNLADDEQGYKLGADTLTGKYPQTKGALVAVSVTHDVQEDGHGDFVALAFKARSRWVDKNGAEEHFGPNANTVTASHALTDLAAEKTADDVIAGLLDGMDGNPKPIPAAMRRAIAAAMAMKKGA
jgi:hypothetical protein